MTVAMWLQLLLAVQAQDYWLQEPPPYASSSVHEKYIITMPGYMGPNALPVPEIKKGLVEEAGFLQLSTEYHLGDGDRTFNTFAKAYLPLVHRRVAIELYGVPYEYFRLQEQTRFSRRARDRSGHTWGDFYFGTIIQLLKDKPVFPDMALSLSCKTAYGNNLVNARFTDAPAYFFDLSFGKNLKPGQLLFRNTRLYGTAGFYVWQTNSAIHRQNDAFLYGLGLETRYQQWNINQAIGGYIGYLDLQDRPGVYRLQLTRQQPRLHYRLEYQAGLHNFSYHSFKLSVLVYFKFLKQLPKPD